MLTAASLPYKLLSAGGGRDGMEMILRITNIDSFDTESGMAEIAGINKAGEDIKAKGRLYIPSLKQSWKIEGEYVDDVFLFVRAERIAWDRLETEDWLAGHGLTAATAKAATDALGDDIYSYPCDESSARTLRGIKGIGEKGVRRVMDGLGTLNAEREVLKKTMGTRIGYQSIVTLISKEGANAPRKLSEDPYSLMLYGAAFAPVDSLALEDGMDIWGEPRVRAAIYEGLRRMQGRGDTRMPHLSFLQAASEITKRDPDGETQVPVSLIDVFLRDNMAKLWKDDGQEYVSPWKLFRQERLIAENLRRLSASARPLIKQDSLGEAVRAAGDEAGIEYNARQAEAFGALSRGGISILTGGPGTGKTTVIGGIVRIAGKALPGASILLCAPTGRAASRMSELSGMEAKTMHKAMGLKWYDGDVAVDTLDYSLIIADEMSMCDTELLSLFLKAAKSGTSIILSGDCDQLPSVGPGQVFRDLIASGLFPVTRLQAVMRQEGGAGSDISAAARSIIAGGMPEPGGGFGVIPARDGEIPDIVRGIAASAAGGSALPQIMSPVKKGSCGTVAINNIVQARLNLPKPEVMVNGFWFRKGDRVIMGENRYDIGYMNGDIGVITEVTGAVFAIQFPQGTLRIALKDLDGMLPAYALTVHKSQGAECEEAVVVLPSGARGMASRELLYTAVTRAKKKVTIVGEPEMIRKYVKTEGKGMRDTGLGHQLERIKKGEKE